MDNCGGDVPGVNGGPLDARKQVDLFAMPLDGRFKPSNLVEHAALDHPVAAPWKQPVAKPLRQIALELSAYQDFPGGIQSPLAPLRQCQLPRPADDSATFLGRSAVEFGQPMPVGQLVVVNKRGTASLRGLEDAVA